MRAFIYGIGKIAQRGNAIGSRYWLVQ